MNLSDDEVAAPDPILHLEDDGGAVQTFAIPDRALRVEAATVSLLEDSDENALKKFGDFENTPRDLQPSWISQHGERMQRKYDDFIRGGLVNVLGDAKVDPAQKQAIVNTARTQSFGTQDSAVALYQAGLVSNSDGETQAGSNVRNTMAMAASETADFLAARQGIVNAALGKKDGTTEQVMNMLSMFVPLEGGITGAKVSLARGDNQQAAAGLLPGSYKKRLNEELGKLPMSEQLAFIQQLATAVSTSSGLTTDSNQMRIESFLNDAVNGVSTTSEIVDNVANILDIVGLGTTIKGLPKALQAGKAGLNSIREGVAAKRGANAQEWFDKRGRDIPLDAPVLNGEAKASIPTKDRNLEKATKLEAEVVELKQSATNQLPRDDYEALRSDLQNLKAQPPKLSARATPQAVERHVEAVQAHKANVDEMEGMLFRHNEAVKAADTIPEIEKNIAELKGAIELEPMALNPLSDAIDRAYNQSVMFTHNPRSSGSVLNLVNMQKARTLQAQIILGQSDDLAAAVHGVSRNEALIKGVAPQVTDASGRVKKVADDIELGFREMMAKQIDGAIKNTRDGFRYTPSELAAGRASVVKDYTEATGLKLNPAMTSVSYDGDAVKFHGVYTNGQGGWSTPEDALAQARYALKDRGVTDDMIEIMRLDGDEFVPVIKSEVAGIEGNYAVRLTVEDRVTNADIKDWDKLDVKRNFLDRFSAHGTNAWGSVNRHIFEPASSLHKTLTGSMSVADDKAALITKHLLTSFQHFTDEYVSLDKAMRTKVDNYIREANVKELPFDPLALSNQFPEKVVDMLKGWRDAWDGMHVLENSDVIAGLTRDGYKKFTNSNIDAVVKERPKRFENNRVYDPASDTHRTLTDQEITDIYKTGGNISEFRRPLDINGTTAEFMIVRNTPTEFARKLNNNDRILEYREGYYQVSYKTPKFIDEKYLDTSGVERTRTVGVAGTTREAKDAIARLQQQTPTSTFVARGDERNIRRSADAYWDLNQSFGRIAQRHRGKLLEDTIGFKTYGADDFIENPADAAVRASLSMGGRIAMQDVLGTARERFMKQFDKQIIGQEGMKQFPTSRDKIGVKGGDTSKELADARTTWEYINYMENGYINAMDEAYKKAFNVLADFAGLGGFDTVEKAARYMGDASPTGKLKGAVFAAYLGTNPIRQWIVQTNQSFRLMGFSHIHYPKVMGVVLDYTMNSQTASALAFRDFWKGTGMTDSIQRSNLVRGTLLEASNRQNGVSRAVDKVLTTGRKIGYDVGENTNNLASAAAVFEKYQRQGANLSDATVKAAMHTEVRALNRNMSYAGDMPYNQNALAAAFTYMQVPHKFALQLFDRQLTVAEKTRLLAADLTLWGVPSGLLATVAGHNLLPENENLRDIITDGLQSWFINTAFTKMAGEKVGIDLSSLAPMDMSSWSKMMGGIFFDKGVSALITNAPGSRVFGLAPDSRLGYALRTTAMFFKDVDQNLYTDVKATDVLDAWGRMSSGYSNFQEARVMYNLRKVVDKQGRTVDDETNTIEAVAKVAGFGTLDSKRYYETIIEAGKVSKNWSDTAKSDVKIQMQMIRGLNDGDMAGARSVAMISQLLADSANFPSKQAHGAYLAAMQAETLKPAWLTVQEKLAVLAGYPDPKNGYADLAKTSPLSAEDKAIYQRAMNSNFKFWQEIEEANKRK